MKFALATAALVGAAAAAPHNTHSQFHKKSILSEIKAAVDSTASNGASWLGEMTEGNHVVNTFMNKADDDVQLVVWGNQGSWINNVQPLVSQTIKAGENLTVSHAIGSAGSPNTGGWAAIYPDTQLVNGQISNLWGEFSFVDDMYSSSTYDVSMEVNMDGHDMTIQGPKCTSSTTQCVFKCSNGATTCGEENTYELVNCEAGSQEGASAGLWGNQAAGGCQGVPNSGITNLYTTLH